VFYLCLLSVQYAQHVILLSGRSLLSPPKNCCFSFGFSSLPPCFVSVSPLLLLVAAAVGDAAGDKAKWRWRSFQRWRERDQRERWVTVLLPYSFVFLFFPSILSSAEVFPSLFVYPVFKTISVPLSNNPCSLLYSVLFFPVFSFSKVLPPLVFIGKRRESPHCLVPSCMAQEGNRVTLPLQGKVAGYLQGMGCINGGRVWDESCFFLASKGRERGK